MDHKEEIQQLKARIAAYEKLLIEAAVPIIPSIVKNTILVPLTGQTNKEHFERIRSKVLDYIGSDRDVEAAVFDFTGVGIENIQDYDYNLFAMEISQLNAALKLMGIRPLYVGFNPTLVRAIVSAGIQVEIETYVNFRTALSILLKENNETLHIS